MPPIRKARIRDTVYVVGAGFSAGLNYPMTDALLREVWPELHGPEREQLEKIVAFHHPEFDAVRPKTFPNIERLLTDIDVNLKLFTSSRPKVGNFTPEKLEAARDNLLLTVDSLFHDRFPAAIRTPWLFKIVQRIQNENAAIVSFNWDLILDHLVF